LHKDQAYMYKYWCFEFKTWV